MCLDLSDSALNKPLTILEYYLSIQLRSFLLWISPTNSAGIILKSTSHDNPCGIAQQWNSELNSFNQHFQMRQAWSSVLNFRAELTTE